MATPREQQLQDTLWPSEPRTLIKHQVYRHYLQCWMAKVLQGFPSATIVDAFSGPGRYSDGPDGSPVVIAKTWLEHSRRDHFGALRVICCEKKPDRVEHLRGEVADLGKHAGLAVEVLAPTSFDEQAVAQISKLADGPVLWLLDPFDISSVPMSLVSQCFRGSRNEVLVTWFSDDVFRFLDDPTKAASRDRYFGGDGWKAALTKHGESARKESLLSSYRTALEGAAIGAALTGDMEISSKNESARYALVFGTHHKAGLECWNPVAWRLDQYAGKSVNEYRGEAQTNLFDEQPDLTPLVAALRARAGTSATFADLEADAHRRGFMTPHLRTALADLRVDGVAFREEPLESSTPWPVSCRVRFYERPSSS